MDWKILLAFGGWIFALIQFILTYTENKSKNKSELLEKTLSYFERGTQSRSIGLSLVEGIWLKEKKNIDIIVPVLVSQVNYLLTQAEDSRQEERNLVRLLFLLEKCLPVVEDSFFDRVEILEALMNSVYSEGGINLGKIWKRSWYKKFGGDIETWDAETYGYDDDKEEDEEEDEDDEGDEGDEN